MKFGTAISGLRTCSHFHILLFYKGFFLEAFFYGFCKNQTNDIVAAHGIS
jgi:hypothetical protein